MNVKGNEWNDQNWMFTNLLSGVRTYSYSHRHFFKFRCSWRLPFLASKKEKEVCNSGFRQKPHIISETWKCGGDGLTPLHVLHSTTMFLSTHKYFPVGFLSSPTCFQMRARSATDPLTYFWRFKHHHTLWLLTHTQKSLPRPPNRYPQVYDVYNFFLKRRLFIYW